MTWIPILLFNFFLFFISRPKNGEKKGNWLICSPILEWNFVSFHWKVNFSAPFMRSGALVVQFYTWKRKIFLIFHTVFPIFPHINRNNNNIIWIFFLCLFFCFFSLPLCVCFYIAARGWYLMLFARQPERNWMWMEYYTSCSSSWHEHYARIHVYTRDSTAMWRWILVRYGRSAMVLQLHADRART